MGYRYENNLDEENERQYLQSFPPWRRWIHRQLCRIVMLMAFVFAFYAHIGWWLWKLIFE
jgi:heme A synthase